MKYLFFLLPITVFAGACQRPLDASVQEKARTEIVAAERAFAQMASEKGVEEAFLNYASNEAVMLRDNNLIKGKPAMETYFEKQVLQNVQLKWEPDFVDAAASGDLGYTYGRYTFFAQDSNGAPVQAEGIFHTVWKKQDDGTWKFVWD